LKDFTPKLASAALLEQFFGAQDTGGQALATLEEAMQLYNDFAFHRKAQDVIGDLANLDPQSETYEDEKVRLEEYLEAYKGNIRNSIFQVS
jgi:hypothetical protein